MTTFREDPAAYMRAYRARKRPEPVVDKALPRGAIENASAVELATVRTKIAATPGGVITKTAGRLDVVTRQAFEAGRQAPAPRITPPTQRHAAHSPSPPTPHLNSPEPSGELATYRPPLQGEVIPPPRSMVADGGTPPRRYAKDASVAEATALIRAYAAEQARINAKTARRLDALERDKAERDRRVAALEDRQARVVRFVQGIAGVFSLVARG